MPDLTPDELTPDAVAGLRQLQQQPWGALRAFASLGVATSTVRVDLLIGKIQGDRVLRVMEKACETPEHAQRAQDVVSREIRNWILQPIEQRIAALLVDGRRLEQWACDGANSYLDMSRQRFGEGTWAVRVLQHLDGDLASIVPSVERAVHAWAKAELRVPVERVPRGFLQSMDFAAAAAATDLLLRAVAAEQDKLRDALKDAEQRVEEIRQRRAEVERLAREAFGQVQTTPAGPAEDQGLLAYIRARISHILKAPEAPLPITDDSTLDARRHSASRETRSFVGEFVKAAVYREALDQACECLVEIQRGLAAFQQELAEATEVLRACRDLAQTELQALDAQFAAEGQSNSVLASLVDMLPPPPSSDALLREWFRLLGLTDEPILIRGKRPAFACRHLSEMVADDPVLQDWRRLTCEELLVRLPASVLAGLVAALVAESRKHISYEQGVVAAPPIQTLLFVPGGDHEGSRLVGLIRRHAMLRAGVSIEESPYDDTLFAVTEAHALSLSQLPGIAHAYRSYGVLPESHPDSYDQVQAFADVRAHAAFSAAQVSREAAFERFLLGLAFGKILDTAAQPGRAKGTQKLIKLVPDSEVETAFAIGHGQVLRSWETLGKSIPEAIETLTTHAECRAQIQGCVERAIAQEGRPVVFGKLSELKRAGRVRKDPELIRHLDRFLSQEGTSHHAA